MLWGYEETKKWKNNKGVTVSEGITYLNGDKFKSISGGGGKGSFPQGMYLIMPVQYLGKDFLNVAAYSKEGLSFFAPLVPNFKTDRTQLGVHPDGGAWGTLGCCGLSEKIQQAYHILETIPSTGVPFEVKLLA